ncbi:MAG: amidohydrolase family protein [Rhodothermales bacterium]
MDSERIILNQTVVVHGDRITHVGPADRVEIPDGALRIDGTDQFLLPGLAEMHGHVPPMTAPREFIDSVLMLYVATGITTVRGMLGWPDQLELRAETNRGDLIAPTLYLAGPSFNGNSISSPEQADQRVREHAAEGWDLLKIHPGLTRAEYDAMANAARESSITFGGHIPADVGLDHALRMGQRSIDHLDGYLEYMDGFNGPVSDAQLAEVVEMTKAAGTWVVPTMALWEVLFGVADLDELMSYPELKYMPPNQVNSWRNQHVQRQSNPNFNEAAAQQAIDNRNRLLGALNDGGAGILMGTDAPQQFSVPGFSLHRELEVMASVGMSPYDILKSGTANVGDYFQGYDAFGRIAPGHRADLILTAANPLEDIGNLQEQRGVMLRGRWLPQSAIDAELDKIAARYE